MLSYDEVKKMEHPNSKVTSEEFMNIIAKDLDIVNNPKSTRMIEIAFQRAGGYWEWYRICCELVELIK